VRRRVCLIFLDSRLTDGGEVVSLTRRPALGSTQTLTEMTTRNLPGCKGRPARMTDNLTAVCEPTVYRKCGSLDVLQPYGSSRSVTGIALPFFTVRTTCMYTKKLRILPIEYICVPYGSHNKQRLFP
jgi:hypothetical protein